MDMAKKISIRILLIALIGIASNYIYTYTFYPSDLEKNGSLNEKLNYGMDNSDILYFSASPNTAYPKGDIDSRSISKILDDQLPQHTVTSVDTGAIHAGVYKKLIELIPDENNIEYIVVNMNYRSFGIGWMMSSLENNISKQSLFYSNRPPLLSRFYQGLNHYDALSKKERHQMMNNYWSTENLPFGEPKNNVNNWCEVEKWGDINNPKRNLADNYIKNYAFIIDENNQRVKDFDEIVELCKAKNITLVYNILGENLAYSEYLVDSDLTSLMLDNKNYLVNRYSQKGVVVIDNFDKVPDSCFYERNFPTEHYSFTGRAIIANQIAKEITKFEAK